MKIKVALVEKEECINNDSTSVGLSFYVTNDAENKGAFSHYPQGTLRLYALTPEAAAGFEVGKKYFVDITPAG